MASDQRRGFIRGGGSDPAETMPVNMELDHVHKRINDLVRPQDRKIFVNYTAIATDRIISCMRGGLTVRLPLLQKEDSGQIIIVKDKSLTASTSNITILPPAGKHIDAATSTSITANGGSKKLAWDFDEDRFFEMP